MPKQSRLIIVITTLFLVVVLTTGCDPSGSSVAPRITPSPTVIPSPTPTPIPMVRITIQLVDVFCGSKENAFGFHDHFYMMTTFAAPGPNPKAKLHTQSQLFQPLDITSGEDLPVTQSPLVVFDGLVPQQQGSVRGGFTAYNDTQGLAWGNIEVWVADIAQTVAGGLITSGIDSGNFYEIGAGVILDLGVKAWYATADLNSGNAHQLGKQDLVVLASGPPSEDIVLHFYNSGGFLGAGGWDYTVRYHITRSLVANGTTPSGS